jgi:hypothetical protein
VATKEHLDLEIRLVAIESVLTQIGKIACVAAGLMPEHARQMSENSRQTFLNEAFPGADPAIADHLSAEIAERVQEHLTHIANAVEAAYIARESQEGNRTS